MAWLCRRRGGSRNAGSHVPAPPSHWAIVSTAPTARPTVAATAWYTRPSDRGRRASIPPGGKIHPVVAQPVDQQRPQELDTEEGPAQRRVFGRHLVQRQYPFQPFESEFDGLITNDKFCFTRHHR